MRLYRERSNSKRYGREACEALERPAIAVISKYKSRAREQGDVLMRVWLTYKQETQRPADIPSQQQG
ncbi:hypothetical protein HRbin02_01266 [Candidatus Calditenuaceae archaeon HR02]|nr:hypothetical protein HRbin02_01266 [Candidatus Calditenuaceae archaeon HR02]